MNLNVSSFLHAKLDNAKTKRFNPSKPIRALGFLLAMLPVLGFSSQAAYAIGSDDPQQLGVDWPPRVAPANVNEARAAINQMKNTKRGPFYRLRWFCNDGMIFPPSPYPCDGRDGGNQHGQWSRDTIAIRNAGWPIANLLVDIDGNDVVGNDVVDTAQARDLLHGLLIEKFLVTYDDGWILRQARFYRGAYQLEDEVAGGNRVLKALLKRPEYLQERFVITREVARLLPNSASVDSLTKVRGMATSLSNKDRNFNELRGKIHGQPDAGDAQRVRSYANSRGKATLASEYEALAVAIDRAYSLDNLAKEVSALNGSRQLSRIADDIGQAQNSWQQFAANAKLLQQLRIEINDLSRDKLLPALNVSLRAEQAVFVAGQGLLGGKDQPEYLNRLQRVELLLTAAQAIYGSGLITAAELESIANTVSELKASRLPLADYRAGLLQLERVPGWAATRMQFLLGKNIEHWSKLEPLAEQYIPDRLRASALLIYSRVIDGLLQDANREAGLQHKLFGQQIGAGLRSLNPGLARGVLENGVNHSSNGAEQIVLVPETVAELPAVAGILTAAEGNALSHVQLLARNLGVPNVVVGDQWLDTVANRAGQRVVVASSPGGVVNIAADNGNWDQIFRDSDEGEKQAMQLDIGKLDLSEQGFLPMLALRASDSGVLAGPKAAKLGELGFRFPGQVSPGLVIPFGSYRALLNKPVSRSDSTPMFTWMQQRYDNLKTLQNSNPSQYQRELSEFLKFMQQWFLQVPLDDAFVADLRRSMQEVFGREGGYGVFVRSDTNVEDLPNFSGAGLNLTVHHVVGFDKTLQAIRRVWASPFTERAFSWRQALVDQPEHVYCSVLLHKSVPAEKSGVLVSKNLDTGQFDAVTVVANQGVGGGVDGQRAEQIKINTNTQAVTRLSSVLAPEKRILLKSGGSQLVPAGNPNELLNANERQQLLAMARKLPAQFPELQAADGRRQAADVEFGFLNGKLWLFQIRPFVENDTAKANAYLRSLDAGLNRTNNRVIDMQQVPSS